MIHIYILVTYRINVYENIWINYKKYKDLWNLRNRVYEETDGNYKNKR